MSKTDLTIEEVKKIAKLSQLNLSNDEVVKFQGQLSEVLNYIDILNEINTDKIEPTSQVTGLENIGRDDEIKDSLSLEEALSGSFETEKKMFATKAVFKNNDES
jgi:aspartyl-tRNA(Asn)/glutamyl-tRNA(Gln) amidotransferase subunit C